MPLLLQEDIPQSGEIGLWRITEPEDWFLTQLDLSDAERERLSRFKGRRRVDWLAARQLVHCMSGRERRGYWYKDDFGKPYLESSDYHISISHSGSLAAAIASPKLVGIDVQQLTPSLERLAHKYMSPDERNSLQPNHRLQQLHVYWGGKEALYKAYGRRALDFCRHMRITPFQYVDAGGSAIGSVSKADYYSEFDLTYRMVEEYMLVYVSEREAILTS